MQLTHQVNVDVQVQIRYRGLEDVQVQIIGIAPYADDQRSATVTTAIDDAPLAAEVAALCESILKAHGMPVAQQAIRDAVQAEAVARARKEF